MKEKNNSYEEKVSANYKKDEKDLISEMKKREAEIKAFNEILKEKHKKSFKVYIKNQIEESAAYIEQNQPKLLEVQEKIKDIEIAKLNRLSMSNNNKVQIISSIVVIVGAVVTLYAALYSAKSKDESVTRNLPITAASVTRQRRGSDSNRQQS